MGVAPEAVRVPAAGPDRGYRRERRPPPLAGLPAVLLRPAATPLALLGPRRWPRHLGLRPAPLHTYRDTRMMRMNVRRRLERQVSNAVTTSATAFIATP